MSWVSPRPAVPMTAKTIEFGTSASQRPRREYPSHTENVIHGDTHDEAGGGGDKIEKVQILREQSKRPHVGEGRDRADDDVSHKLDGNPIGSTYEQRR